MLNLAVDHDDDFSFAAPQIEVPSISGSAMLVELCISNWAGNKLDKSASRKVTLDNRASTGVANVHKKLLADCAELSAVIKFAANARQAHYAMTMPWSDTGLRLLPTAKYFDYNAQMIHLQAQYNQLVESFLDAYEWEITKAQAALGDLFNRDEYPTVYALRGKFSMSFTYIPLPDAGDWRVDIGGVAQQELKTHYAGYYQKQLAAAMGDLYKRAHDALSRMSERLDYGDSETKKIFRDTLVSNVLEIVDMMDSCNLTNDPVMSSSSRTLREALNHVDADDLRSDAALRSATKRKVDEVLATLPSLDM